MCSEVSANSPGNSWSQSRRRKKGYGGKDLQNRNVHNWPLMNVFYVFSAGKSWLLTFYLENLVGSANWLDPTDLTSGRVRPDPKSGWESTSLGPDVQNILRYIIILSRLSQDRLNLQRVKMSLGNTIS